LSAAPAGIEARQRAADLLAGFPSALRQAGLAVDPGRAAAFFQAARVAPMRSLADLSRAGRVTLAGSPDDLAIFDAVFKAWFADDALPQILESPDEQQAPAAKQGEGHARGGSGHGRHQDGCALTIICLPIGLKGKRRYRPISQSQVGRRDLIVSGRKRGATRVTVQPSARSRSARPICE